VLPTTLFLDFDGVLHPADAGPRIQDILSRPPVLDSRVFSNLPALEEAVRQICAGGGKVEICLTTSWRKALMLDELRPYLGLTLSPLAVAITPLMNDGQHRSDEVLAYLHENPRTNWIVIDDNPSSLWDILDSDDRHRVLITDPYDGFTAEDGLQLVSLCTGVDEPEASNLISAEQESLVIFADIDGVFHDADTEPFCWAPLLWEAIAPHSVSIVIHSSWRNVKTLEAIRSEFPSEMQERIIAVTEGIEPYDSILSYIEEHRVGRFVVLDDSWERFPPRWIDEGILIPCDTGSGLSAPGVIQRVRRFVQQATTE
jgi:hypothetical protein